MRAERESTRRTFIRRAGASGALLALGVATGAVSACGGGQTQGGGATNARPAGRGTAVDPCSDLTGLSEGEKSFREESGYVAETSDPARRCDNCAFWESPPAGSTCGGCLVMAGPIAAAAYCDLWEAQE
jgi:hypothetical protein